jgi:hypothetical protein
MSGLTVALALALYAARSREAAVAPAQPRMAEREATRYAPPTRTPAPAPQPSARAAPTIVPEPTNEPARAPTDAPADAAPPLLPDDQQERAAAMTLDAAKRALAQRDRGSLFMLQQLVAARSDDQLLSFPDATALDLAMACLDGAPEAVERARAFLGSVHTSALDAPLKDACRVAE